MASSKLVTIKVIYACHHSKTIECKDDEIISKRRGYQRHDCPRCKAEKALESASTWDFPPLVGESEQKKLRAIDRRDEIMKTLVADAKQTFPDRTTDMTEEQRERMRVIMKTRLRNMGQRTKAEDWLKDDRLGQTQLLDRIYGSADYDLRSYPPKTLAELQEAYEALRRSCKKP